MLPYRMKPWLAVCGLVLLLGAPAFAQTESDLRFFDPKVPGGFGGGPAPNEGYFFSYNALYWTLSRPSVATIGNPTIAREVFFSTDNSTIETNTLNTGFLTSDWSWGNRYEFGDISGQHGWLVSYYDVRLQTQMQEFSNVVMTIDDVPFATSTAPGGTGVQRHLDGFLLQPDTPPANGVAFSAVPKPLPLRFDSMLVENFLKTWSVEANYMYRTHPWGFDRSLLSEFFFGVRYLQFDDTFNVFGTGQRLRDIGTGALPEPNTVLADSEWRTEARNHIIGPQIATRLFTRRGRWEFSTEGKFFAGINMQDVHQNGVFGTRLNDPVGLPLTNFVIVGNRPANAAPWVPFAGEPATFDRSFQKNLFSPGFEVRADAKLHLTRGFNLTAGYTLVWLDNIARASDMIDYVWAGSAPLGIRTDQNKQSAFMNGLTFGLEFNR